MTDAAGSPLAARQNPFVYLIIVYLAIAIGIIFAIYILYKIIQNKHKSPEYIEKQKQKPTVYTDVTKVAKKLNLSKEETTILWRTCHHTKANNIQYTYNDDDYMNKVFKQEYQHMIKSNAPDKAILDLFHLRFHIYKEATFSLYITSSHNIPLGTLLSYPAPSGYQYQFTLMQNDKNGLKLSVPETMEEDSSDRPDKLNKIAMIFSLPNGQQYAIVSRVIQLLKMPNGEQLLSITHSNTLCPQSRRASKRFIVNRECSFSAVESSTGKNGDLSLKAKEKCYDGTIVDLSEGGCKLYTTLPIKKGQFIYLRFEIAGNITGVFGQIADTRTDFDSGMYSLHIGFKQFPVETKVKLLADLYEWNS